MKYIADAMLGRLATWMRVLGCDVEYHRRIGDSELVTRARECGRVILTRDRRLVLRRSARDRSFLVESNDFRGQLREVAERFGIRPGDRVLTRCLRCNRELEDVTAGEVGDTVPPYVLGTQKSFRKCRACGRIYWGGTHRDRMRAELDRILGREEGN